MTLQDLGNLGELVAAIATAMTLIYLAIQIRQNTAVVRTSNFADLSARSSSVAQQLAGDSVLMAIWQRRLDDYKGLPELDRGRFHMVLSQFLSAYQLLMQLESRSLVDKELYEQQLVSLVELFKCVGVRQWWSEEGRWYPAGFREFVDRNFPPVT